MDSQPPKSEAPRGQSETKRKPGRPAGNPWGEPLGVSPEALMQAVLRPPKPKQQDE